MERIGLTPGSEIGGYTVVAPLGSGGMGTVYRAVDGGGDAVALKLLHPHIGADAVAPRAAAPRGAALQRLRHPAVAAVLDAEADSTEAFIVTELVDGENLADHVRERGPLDADDLLDLADGLLDALAAVHGAGVVHRDLKPSNVIVTDDGPVLIDFGIAQAADDSRLTAEGLVVGTPGYLAPELLDGDEPDARLATSGAGPPSSRSRRPAARRSARRPLEAVLARARSGEVDVEGLGPLTTATLTRRARARRRRPHRAGRRRRRAHAGRGGGRVDADETATVVLVADDLVGTDGARRPSSATVGRRRARPSPAAVVAPAVAANDGRTPRVRPGGAARRARSRTDWDEDPDGVDWIEEDLDASEEPEPEGSGYERPPARRRWGTLLARRRSCWAPPARSSRSSR